MTKKNPPIEVDYNEFNNLINSQIAQNSNFLQEVSRVIGRPLVLACSLSTEPDLVVHGDKDNVQADVTGLTIALKCPPDLAQEILDTFDRIMIGYNKRSQN